MSLRVRTVAVASGVALLDLSALAEQRAPREQGRSELACSRSQIHSDAPVYGNLSAVVYALWMPISASSAE